MRVISSQVSLEIVRKLPNLRTVDWFTYDENLSYPEQRQKNRDLFTRTIQQQLPEMSQLQSLRIFMNHGKFYNRPWIPIGSQPVKDSSDSLSKSIREETAMLKGLKSLAVSGVFDELLLWPDLNAEIVEPFWQNLEHLHVKFHTTKPSGGAYFRARTQAESANPLFLAASNTQMPPGYGTSEVSDIEVTQNGQYSNGREHGENFPPELLYIPDEEFISPLIEAFGRAISQMPALKVVSLTTTIAMYVTLHSARGRVMDTTWGIWFAAPGESFGSELQEHPAFSENMGQRRLIFDVQKWRPNEHLRSILRGVGRERHGDTLVEEYIDYWSTVRRSAVLYYDRMVYLNVAREFNKRRRLSEDLKGIV
jgi:hypothetical protein